MAEGDLFNFRGEGVQEAAQLTLAQLTLTEETKQMLDNARRRIEQGAWTGPAAQQFIDDATTLSNEIEAQIDMLSTFLARLTQAANNTEDTANLVLNLANQIP
jgi:uncharacterized protein YukE